MRFLTAALNRGLTQVPANAGVFLPRNVRATQWQYIDRYQLGVLPWDPVGHEIGLSRTRSGVFTSFAQYKQTLVGTVLEYSFYDGDGDEADWNISVLPDPRYRFILDEVRAVMANPGDLKTVNGQEAVQCEITPDENFYDNPYFERPAFGPGTSTLTGRKVGLYGPWVRDSGHGGRPEIHPCEVIWWLDRVGPQQRRRWTMLVVQDDSNRFDLRSNYTGGIAHPWSEVPRRAALTLAGRARTGTRARYRLSVGRHRNMAVMSGPISTVDERDYFISASYGRGRLPGVPEAAVSVERRIDRPRDVDPGEPADLIGGTVAGRSIPPFPDVFSPGMLDVSLTQVDRQAVNGGYRFFINLQVQVGATNRGREGYAEIVLSELDPEPVLDRAVVREIDRVRAVAGVQGHR